MPPARPVGRPRNARLLALASGASLALAFEPIGLSPLALLAPASLLVLWQRAGSAREAGWLGFCFGLGLFGAGVSWVYVSLSLFGGMPAPLAALATLLFCAYLALFPAAVGYASRRIPTGNALRSLVLAPALWSLSEVLRGWAFTGFPWLALGYAATDTPLAGYASLAGVYGISFLAVCCAGLLAQTLLRCRRTASLAALAVLLLTGWGLQQQQWTRPEGAPVSVGLLQGNIAQDMKFDPARYARTLATYERLATQAPAQLIILPETAVPRFLDRVDPEYLGRLEAIARGNRGDLLLGVPYRSAPDAYFNAVVSLGMSPSQRYAKQHLVPFGEFIPPGFGWVPSVLQIPMSDFSRGGPTQAPLSVAGQKVAVNICYEDVFGAELRDAAARSTLLANVSNVAWFGDSLAPGQHLQIARLRALEAGRAHVTATNTGVTAAIDRDGRVLGRLPQFTEGRLDVSVQGYTGLTPYLRWGDMPVIVLSLLCLLLPAALSALWRRG